MSLNQLILCHLRLQLCNHQNLLETVKLRYRNQISGFRQSGGICRNVRRISNQNSWQKLRADIRRNNSVSIFNISICSNIGNPETAFSKQSQIPGHNTGIARLLSHSADAAYIVYNRTYCGIVSPYIRDNAYQTASGHNIGIYPDSICSSLINAEYLEPVSRILGNDPGADFFILHIFLIQIIKLTQTLQFKLFRLKAAVFLNQLINLSLKNLFFIHGTLQPAEIADPVVQGRSCFINT